MKEIKAILQPHMLEQVLHALEQVPDLPGLTVSRVQGWGRSRESNVRALVHEGGHAFADKVKLEIVVADEAAERVVAAIVAHARTGSAGDGKIFVYDLGDVVRIRTGERDKEAL